MNDKETRMLLKVLYLVIFCIGLALLYFNTSAMIGGSGFDGMTGASTAADHRTVYIFIALFGLVSYFVEMVRDFLQKK